MEDLPEGKKTISLKWVFKTKFDTNGRLQKHKARLVAKRLCTITWYWFWRNNFFGSTFWNGETCFSFGSTITMVVYQFDVKSTFFNDELQEEVYVTQSEGFVKKGNETKVYKLKKTLYGLK